MTDTTNAPKPDPNAADLADRTVLAESVADTDATVFVTPSAPPVADIAPLPQPVSAATSTPIKVDVGTTINNNYQVLEILKAGGMGEVYRGVEIGTGDPVAIKAILPELAADEKAGQLFKREARTLRQLSDDAIVRYYNYVHDRDLDRYFLVMEFIVGTPLSDHIKQNGAISSVAAVTLLKRLAKGLSKAHGQDVIHRDLSPDNVMLPNGIISEARLIDFGIAKSNALAEGTVAGQFAGKFKFVAPEQLGHFGGTITAATDVYGLALLIAAAVAGAPLDMGSSIVQAVEARRSIPDLSSVPADLRALLAHMLEPDPADRPATLHHLLQMLDQPDLLPQKYRDQGPMPPTTGAMTAGPGVGQTFAGTGTTSGLQTPTLGATPVAHRPTVLGGAVPPTPHPEPKTQIRGAVVAFVVLSVVAGIGGVIWQTGGLSSVLNTDNSAATVAETRTSGGLPPVQATTREGFLASVTSGPCAYATRITEGENSGMLETYGTTPDKFATLSATYAERFGTSPALKSRVIQDPQCAVVDFTHALQGRLADTVAMDISEDTMVSGGSLRAEISAPQGQQIWTALITPTGALYNLSNRLERGPAGGRVLDIGLNLTDGAVSAPQLLLTLASDAPLPRAATVRDGTLAADFFPRLLADITSGGHLVSASVDYVLLTPKKTVSQ